MGQAKRKHLAGHVPAPPPAPEPPHTSAYATRSPAHIHIGGVLPRSAVVALAHALVADGCSPAWDGDPTLAEALEMIAKANREGTALYGTSPHAVGGAFATLIAVCRDLGLSFVQADWGDPSDQRSPEVVHYDARTNSRHQWAGIFDETYPHLSQAAIREHLKAGTLDAELDRMRAAETFNEPLVIHENLWRAQIGNNTPLYFTTAREMSLDTRIRAACSADRPIAVRAPDA